jgi:3-oxoacyl-[acyl-carrier protein] reductase
VASEQGIARRLCDDGAAVAITYFSSKIPASELGQALASKGQRAAAIKADYGDADSITRAVEQVAKGAAFPDEAKSLPDGI